MKIIHLSDLHFGKDLPDVVSVLLTKLKTMQPDHIIISGDFTQIANEEEFRKAQAFVEALPGPVFCVPGNHDVPAFNLFQRFFKPYDLYKTFINQELCPVSEHDHAHIVGLNSARRALPHWNWANGAISNRQRYFMQESFSSVGPNKWRICVLHHPIHKIDDMPMDVTVFGRKRTLAVMDKLEVDLVLTGHVHHSSIMTRESASGHRGVYVSASTATSSRKRSHENGFNAITLKDEEMLVESYSLEKGQFELSKSLSHYKK